MNTDDSENPLNDLIQQAVKIKGAQSKQLRREFDTWPEYLQNSLFQPRLDCKTSDDDDNNSSREEAVAKYKANGASFVKEKNYQDAYKEYEKALGLYKYVINTDPDWKQKGIIDESLKIITNYNEDTDTIRILISLYNNIALCSFHLRRYHQSILACNDALRLDSRNPKALYRRGMARLTPPSSGAAEQELAFKDLKLALNADPNNVTIRKQVNSLIQSIKCQKQSDAKTFSGMFDRGNIICHASQEESTKKPSPPVDLYRQIQEATVAVKLLRDRGDDAQADLIQQKIDKAKQGRSTTTPTVPENLDFLNPTAEMIKDAKETSGIDLTDKKIQSYLHSLQQEKLHGKKTSSTYYQKNNYLFIGRVLAVLVVALGIGYIYYNTSAK